MTAKGHIIFAIASVILIKKITFLSILPINSNWGHLIVGTILTCLLPDIDHPKSWLGRTFKFLSIPISRLFGHRGITHSLLAVIILIFFCEKSFLSLIFPVDIVNAMIISYISHIFADMLTPSGVPLLWPFFWCFRIPLLYPSKNILYEKVFCTLSLILAILYPLNIKLFDNLIKYIF